MSSRRERIVPALLAAVPATFLAASGSLPILSVVALAALVGSMVLSRPAKWRSGWGWLVGAFYAGSLAMRLLDERSREPWLVAGWFFATMAALQAACWGNGARRGVLVWNSLLAMAIGSAGGRWIQWTGAGIELALALGFLAWPFSVKKTFPGGAWRLAGLLALAGTLAAAASWVQVHSSGRWGGGGRWGRHDRSLMGFSGISRLGSFQSEYGNGGEAVALRLFADTVPRYLQGQVHAFYHQGSWIAERKLRSLESPRMVRDAAVFCRDGRDPGVRPSGWMSLSASSFGLAPLPPDAPCLAAVADSADVNGGGAVSVRGASWGRGIWWFGGRHQDTTILESDLKVPRELEGFLDSAWELSGREGGDRTGFSAVRRLGSWFQSTFRYALVVPERSGQDPLVTFLSERRGYCEYFATASVLLLRRQGIPARYVTGYAEPERTAPGIATFRRSHAHAWVSWRDSAGTWSVFDPTPASDDALPSRRGSTWWEELAARATLWWHGFRDGNWRSILDEPQRWGEALVENAKPTWRWLWGIPPLLLGGLLLRWRRRRAGIRTTDSVWILELARVEASLARKGIRREPGETVGSLLSRWPEQGDEASRAFLERYQRERFRGRGEETP